MNESAPTPGFQTQPRDRLRHAGRFSPLRHIIGELNRVLSSLVAVLQLPSDARVLDFGCAEKPYRRLFPATVDYVGADLPGNPAADVTINPDGTLPLPDASFDAVFSSQVLEHVNDPVVYLSECHRVLRPGGTLLLSTHGIMVHHPDPVDYWRWTNEGLRRIVMQAGFRVERFEGIMGLAATGLHLFQHATYRRVFRWLRPLYVAIMQTLVALADRLTDAEGKARNALVFALVARKPA